MKTTAEKIAVMQAYLDGKVIEHRSGDYPTWDKVTKPAWAWDTDDYRVKPKPEPEPEYIPFTFEDAEFLIGKLVIHKTANHLAIITSCFNEATNMGGYKKLLEDYTFIDGSPCGKLKSK